MVLLRNNKNTTKYNYSSNNCDRDVIASSTDEDEMIMMIIDSSNNDDDDSITSTIPTTTANDCCRGDSVSVLSEDINMQEEEEEKSQKRKKKSVKINLAMNMEYENKHYCIIQVVDDDSCDNDCDSDDDDDDWDIIDSNDNNVFVSSACVKHQVWYQPQDYKRFKAQTKNNARRLNYDDYSAKRKEYSLFNIIAGSATSRSSSSAAVMSYETTMMDAYQYCCENSGSSSSSSNGTSEERFNNTTTKLSDIQQSLRQWATASDDSSTATTKRPRMISSPSDFNSNNSSRVGLHKQILPQLRKELNSRRSQVIEMVLSMQYDHKMSSCYYDYDSGDDDVGMVADSIRDCCTRISQPSQLFASLLGSALESAIYEQ